jgi:putative methyltransferase (TIGR04325 family)
VFCLFSLINPIIESNKKEINVLDFGGSSGLHYFQARTILNKSLKLNWIVVETPAMVEHAKELESDELRFSASLKEAQEKFDNIDIIITSGTLQCVDDPQKYLNELLNCNAKWILFTRLGLNQLDRDVIIVFKTSLAKNGVGELPEGYVDREVRYPFTFHSEKKFIETIEKKYKIVSKFDDKTGSFPIVNEDITGYGLLCLNKNHIDQ